MAVRKTREAWHERRKRMFEKFGEMNSYEEINELAGNLLKEGDRASIKADRKSVV